MGEGGASVEGKESVEDSGLTLQWSVSGAFSLEVSGEVLGMSSVAFAANGSLAGTSGAHSQAREPSVAHTTPAAKARERRRHRENSDSESAAPAPAESSALRPPLLSLRIASMTACTSGSTSAPVFGGAAWGGGATGKGSAGAGAAGGSAGGAGTGSAGGAGTGSAGAGTGSAGV